MLLKFSFFFIVALVTATTQDFRNLNRNDLSKIAQTMKTSQLIRESPSIDIDEDRDGAIMNFLTHAMENYHTWLAKRDPTNPDPSEVTLSTTALGQYDLVDLDAILKIRNQYMANHSKLGLETVAFGLSKVAYSWFNAVRGVYYGDDVTFGGNYNVTGSINITDTLKIPFSGQGNWTLKGNQIGEVGAYNDYVVDENGYIDISSPIFITTPYTYRNTWNHMEFEGLEFNYEGEIDENWMPILKDRLAQLYGLFLYNGLEFHDLSEYHPPKQLFNAYLQERFQSTKLEDIISGWQPTTAAPTDPPVTDNGNNIFGSLWGCILTSGAVLLYI